MNQYDTLKKAIDSYIGLVTYQMKTSSWVNGVMPGYEYLSGDTSNYHLIGEQEISSHDVQFMQKVIVPPGSRVVVLGDLHGDEPALLHICEQLKKIGIIDEQGRQLQENCYLACVGDYVNRHPRSPQVVEFLCTLAVDNPGKVFLTRGNHEYALTNKFFRIRFDLAKARGEDYPAASCFLDELEKMKPDYTYPDLLYWYDYLPASVFIGFQSETSGKTNYVQICHAGLELGWSAYELLKQESVGFERVMTIDRQAALDCLAEDPKYKKYNDELKNVIALLKEQEFEHFAELYDNPEPLDLTKPASPFHHRFGWQWNNFLSSYNSEPLIAASGQRRNLFFNREFTQYLFDVASSKNAQLVSLFRGHQHCDDVIEEQHVSSHFLTDIRKNKGLIRQWDGLVNTLGATKSVSHCYSFVMFEIDDHNKISVAHWHRGVGDTDEWSVV